MEVKYCTYKKKLIEIEPKNKNFFNGKKQSVKKIGYDWNTCSEGPCEKCTRQEDILEKI